MIGTRSQKGSAHVAIIIVLVLALIGALGWIFWQNFATKTGKVSNYKECTKAIDSKLQESYPEVCVTKDGQRFVNPDQKAEKSGAGASDKTTIKTKTLVMNTVFANGLSLEYPENWQISHVKSANNAPAKVGAFNSDEYILTSPDSSIDLSIKQASGGGLGGTCDPENTPTFSSFSYEESKLWSVKSYADYVYFDSGKYFVAQGLADNERTKTIKAGDSLCKGGYLYYIDTGRKLDSTDAIVMFTGITKHGVNDMVTFTTYDSAKAYLASQNAFDIKGILLSLK